MRKRQRGIRWRRVVVWWVVGTVVIVGMEVVAVWWVGTLPATAASSGFAFWLIEGGDNARSTFSVWHYSDLRMCGSVASHNFDANYAGVPSVIRTGDGSLDALSNDGIKGAIPDRASGVGRIRDVLGALRRTNGSELHATAIDLACLVPIGMNLRNELGGKVSKYLVPESIRRTYPLIITIGPGKRHVLVHWNVLWIASVGGIIGALMPVGMVELRRFARRTKNRCAWCGYSLVGIAGDAPCPECGSGRG